MIFIEQKFVFFLSFIWKEKKILFAYIFPKYGFKWMNNQLKSKWNDIDLEQEKLSFIESRVIEFDRNIFVKDNSM